MTPTEFKKKIWAYYRHNRRSFPWREEITPYNVVVSEVMLQQTQAPRVVAKYNQFLKKFPNFKTLAEASNEEILREWQGLGYNRRGLNLKRLAKEIVNKHKGNVPTDPDELLNLPGIGPGTVGSILAFAHNIPHPFIETNIRTVYLHFFFSDKKEVHDKQLFPLIEKTLDRKKPREWYYALMDYGVMLKKLLKNPSRNSIHYKKQSAFKGSNRDLRSRILKEILKGLEPTESYIVKNINQKANPSFTKELILKNISALEKEGFIKRKGTKFKING